MKKIQRIELPDSGASIHCPFCGTKVVNGGEGADTWLAEPCGHTLFVAHDEGFEYASDAFKDHVKTMVAKIEDPEDREDFDDLEELETFDNADALTDLVELDGAIKFAIYMGAPAQFGSYIGFVAPTEE